MEAFSFERLHSAQNVRMGVARTEHFAAILSDEMYYTTAGNNLEQRLSHTQGRRLQSGHHAL